MAGKENRIKMGVLALQGAVKEHIDFIIQLGAEAVEVKRQEQLDDLDGLIIPGGESTTIGKLMNLYGLMEPLREKALKGFPIFGTCAGLIILADESHLGVLDATVKRNAFGRQKDSFEAPLPVQGVSGGNYPAVFIRGPYIEKTNDNVEILSQIEDSIVAVRQGNLLGVAFHPELTADFRLHQYFLDIVRESRVTFSHK